MNLLINDFIIRILDSQSLHDYQKIIFGEKIPLELGTDEYYETVSLLKIANSRNNSIFWVSIFTANQIITFITVNSMKNQILIGYDHSVAVIDLSTQCLIFEKRMNSLVVFSTFVNEEVLVLSETDVKIYSCIGETIESQMFEDVLIDYNYSDGILTCYTEFGTHTIACNNLK